MTRDPSEMLCKDDPPSARSDFGREHGGIITSLARDGSVLDTDKSVWFRGCARWTFATPYNTVERPAPCGRRT